MSPEGLSASLLLRDVSAEDLPAFFEHQLDPAATRMAAFPSRDREAFMAHWAKIMADPSNVLKTILYEGRVAGNVVSWEQDGRREVGYWLGREFWGRGIATRALALFLEQVRTRPLFAHVAVHNLGSICVLEKCGFAPYTEGQASDIPEGEVEELVLRLEWIALIRGGFPSPREPLPG